MSCTDGYWGIDCSEKCGNCSNSEVCDKVTGHCSSCSPGLKPPLCRAEETKGSDDGAIAGAVVGVLIILAIVVAVVVFVIRRRRNKSANAKKPGIEDIHENNSERPSQGAVYQNLGLLDAESGETQRAPDKIDKSKQAPYPKTKHPQMKGKKKPASTSTSGGGQGYVNVKFKNDAVDPNVCLEKLPTSSVPKVSAPTLPPVEEDNVDDVDDVEDDEVVVEGDRSYDVAVKERVYYNDEVYMTSEGAGLKLDSVQEYLLKKLRGNDIDTEYKNLPVGLLKSHDVGLKKENKDRNRFKSILPYDETRVVLRGPADPGSNDYINGCYIRGHRFPKDYIATQGPKRGTLGDFWKMVWQNKVSHIVMLTNLKENKKRKCEGYWPALGKEWRYGSVDVAGVEEHHKADYVIRIFRVQLGGDKARRVAQYHYTTWPDHDIPKSTALVDFWKTVNMVHKSQEKSSPLLVHCSAGIGRTGTFIALDIVMNKLHEQHDFDIFNVVKDMRDDRCHMIQTKSQYCVLHEAILEAYTSRNSRLRLETFDSAFKHPVDPNDTHDRIDGEFNGLKQMKVLMQKPSHKEAEKQENINKNRFVDVLPDDSQLVPLTVPMDGRNEYINAVFMPTLQRQEGYILTQLPLSDTIVDLWRLVAGHDVSTIVSFGGEMDEVENKNCYWPRQIGQNQTYGPISIRLTSLSTLGQHLLKYSLSVHCQGMTEPREVELLHLSEWRGEIPSSIPDLIRLVHIVLSTRSPQDKSVSPVLLQCGNGATKSGMFHALCDVIRRMTSDRVIDVYMVVRKMQVVRPQCVTSQVQYRCIYKALQEYKKNRDIYSNL
ncbi:receptor-type tyrosine-protein phosphatase epsilon-like [Littorina saxatilis]|uniref:receptor-type tyrosine-protein phosphatase epsilon-like n=1 Tax=Littorina saxatilis TaxID=31220 RepID=UPI0038B553E6